MLPSFDPRNLRVDERKLDVLERRGSRQQIECLEDEADLLIAHRRELVVAHRFDRCPVQDVLAVAGLVETSDDQRASDCWISVDAAGG